MIDYAPVAERENQYAAPFRIHLRGDRHTHNALIALALEAKRAGSPWADMALAQISALTGLDYRFARETVPGRVEITIERGTQP